MGTSRWSYPWRAHLVLESSCFVPPAAGTRPSLSGPAIFAALIWPGGSHPVASTRLRWRSSAVGDEEKPPELRRANMFGVVSALVLALLVALGVKRPLARWERRGGSSAFRHLAACDGGVATADDIGIRSSAPRRAGPGRSEAAIRHAIDPHFAELQQSYLTALNADSNAEGVVTLHMTLAADGTVAYVRSTPLGLADRGFVTIIERQAAAWRFVPSRAGLVSVHYPLVFHLAKTGPHRARDAPARAEWTRVMST